MLEYDFIETPENVELRQRLAGIGTRLIAGVIDHLLIAGLFLLLMLGLWALGFSLDFLSRTMPMQLLALLMIGGFLIYWGYFTFFEMLMNGQSPGKRRMKIRVVKEGGAPITFTDIVIRNLIRAVDALPVVYGVAGICMFFTKRVQRLGDLAAGTVVISEMTGDYNARSDKPIKQAWEREASPSALRATGLKPEEYRALTSYYLRQEQLTLEARQRVLPRLLVPILKRMGKAPADGSFETLERQLEELMAQAEEVEGSGQDPAGGGQ